MSRRTRSAPAGERAPAVRDRARPPPTPVAVVAALALAAATVALFQGVDVVVTWYYVLAWYPTLVLLDCAVAARTGAYFALTRPGFAASLLGWSAIAWFVFEAANFRLANWYYVYLPESLPVRWTGTTVSFMTVLPAIFLGERWLAAGGFADGVRWPGFAVTGRLLRGVLLTGIIFAILTLAWPRLFFPMVWGALTLMLEPWNYHRDPGRSLLGDLAAGRPGRILRLLVGGLGIGFIWELYNLRALSKWIYTVPGFESFKLFEMPLPGFLGFPVFALDCFVIYQSLVLSGLAVPRPDDRGTGVEKPGGAGTTAPVGTERTPRLRTGRLVAAVPAAVLFSVAVLLGMDRWTVDSHLPRLERLWLLDPTQVTALQGSDYADIFRLAQADPGPVAGAADVSPAVSERWIRAAGLATLRGIGTRNARLLWEAGVRSRRELAAADPEALSSRLRSVADRPRAATPPRVRVWVHAAGRALPSREARER